MVGHGRCPWLADGAHVGVGLRRVGMGLLCFHGRCPWLADGAPLGLGSDGLNGVVVCFLADAKGLHVKTIAGEYIEINVAFNSIYTAAVIKLPELEIGLHSRLLRPVMGNP